MAFSAPSQLGTSLDSVSASSKTITSVTAAVDTLVILSGRINSGGGGLTGVSVSDSSSNTWTVYQNGTGSARVFIAWTVITTGKALSSGTVTFTRTGSTNITSHGATLVSFTGEVLTSTEDTAARVSSTGSTTGYSPTITSGTPANSGDLFIGVCGYGLNGAAIVYTEDSGHGWSTAHSAQTTAFGVFTAYQVNAGAGTLIYGPGISGSSPGSDNWMEAVTAFIALGGGGGGFKPGWTMGATRTMGAVF